jgi:CubicO group peptidase (beta-lactamase class C family)
MRTNRRVTTVAAPIFVVVLGLVSLRGAPAPMTRATPEAVGMSTERLQMVTALLRQFVADHKIAGAVAAIARRGKLIYLEPVGLQSLETRAPMTERSLFRIYSMTKAVTAAGVMMLVEDSKLRLDDPVSKYLPEFKNVMVQEGGTGAP